MEQNELLQYLNSTPSLLSLLYDIDIKFYELKKNKIDINTADKIFDDYYKIKINEFNNKLIMARKIYK